MVRRWEKIRIPIFVWRGEYQFYFFSIHYTLQHLRISKDLCILDTMFFVAIKSVNTRYKRFFSQSWDMFIELATAFLYICQSESSYHLPSEPIAPSPGQQTTARPAEEVKIWEIKNSQSLCKFGSFVWFDWLLQLTSDTPVVRKC